MLSHLFKRKPLLKLKVDDPSSIELRPYNKETDYQAVIDVIGSRYPEVGITLDLEGVDISLTDIDHYWREPGGEFMVLTRNNSVIGSMAGRPIAKEPRHAEFASFFLKRNEEAKGLGLMLMKWGFQWCQANNIEIVELWSNEDRKLAHKLYRKIGFTENGIRRPYKNGTYSQYQRYFELDLTNKNQIKQLQETILTINF